MGTDAPTIVTIPLHCAPKKAPCPKCGKHGRRKRKLPPRKVRTVVHKAIAYLEKSNDSRIGVRTALHPDLGAVSVRERGVCIDTSRVRRSQPKSIDDSMDVWICFSRRNRQIEDWESVSLW